MKSFFNGLISVIIVLIIILFEFTLGILFCIQNSIKVNSISNAIQSVDFKTIMYTDDNQLTEVGVAINDMFKEMGFNVEDTKELLETPTLKRVLGDLVGSAVMSTVEDGVEIDFPTKEEVKDIVDECYDIASKSQKIDLSKEEIKKIVDDNYDKFIADLKNYAGDLTEGFNFDDDINFGSSSHNVVEKPVLNDFSLNNFQGGYPNE